MARPRSPDTDQRIFAAAAKLVAEHGYADTALEAVAREAGVGKTTLYRRWPSKPALMAACYAHLVPAGDFGADTGSFAGDLTHLLGHLFRRYRATPAARILAGLIARAQDNPETLTALHGGIIEGRRDIITEAARRALGRGERLQVATPEQANDLVVALVWHRLLTDPNGLDDAYADHIVRTLLAKETSS